MARLFCARNLRFSRDPRFAERDVSEPQLNTIARLFDRTYRFRIDSASLGFNGAVTMDEDKDMRDQVRSIESHWQLLLVVLLLAGAAVSRAEFEAETRLSTTSQGKSIQRGGVGDGTVSHDEYEPLVTVGARQKPVRTTVQQKLTGASQGSTTQTPNTDFWFYDVDVELFSDFDHDGYFYGIDLWFDADTIYAAADVYAVIYLSYEYGPWNEYAATEDFTLFGASGGDAYVIETELISGYETGNYDILIELFDAFDGTFIADIGPEGSSELSLLPLEDSNRDAPIETHVIVNHGGGGSPGWLLLLALMSACAVTKHRRMRGAA